MRLINKFSIQIVRNFRISTCYLTNPEVAALRSKKSRSSEPKVVFFIIHLSENNKLIQILAPIFC